MVRLFIAINLPKKIKKILNMVSNDLPENVKKIPAKNLHITLHFIGETNQKQIPKIVSKLNELKYKQFDIEVKDVGTFPPTKKPRIVWVGCENTHLYNLSKKISKYLGGEEQRFKPHITIGRIKKWANLNEFIKKYKELSFGRFRVKTYALMESRLNPKGAEYYIIHEFDLG